MKNNMETQNKRLEQLIMYWGNGKLKDESECSQRLRAHLKEASIDDLARYTKECLDGFLHDKSVVGFALQDIVNEFGRRLEFGVQHGRYRGTRSNNTEGWDGLWELMDGRRIIIEVKTTDAYRISLDTLAQYRAKIDQRDSDDKSSSILIIVGRQDTGDLESQVRGSRYSHNIRLISVEKIIDIIRLKNKNMQVSTMQDILTPKEFTKLDEVIDLVFDTVEESGDGDEIVKAIHTAKPETEIFSLIENPKDNTDFCLQRVFSHFNNISGKVERYKQSLYYMPDAKIRFVMLLSKKYKKYTSDFRYWFTLRSWHKEFLKDNQSDDTAYCVLGGKTGEFMFAIPMKLILEHANKMHESRQGAHVHTHIDIICKNNAFYLRTRGNAEGIEITKFLLNKDTVPHAPELSNQSPKNADVFNDKNTCNGS